MMQRITSDVQYDNNIHMTAFSSYSPHRIHANCQMRLEYTNHVSDELFALEEMHKGNTWLEKKKFLSVLFGWAPFF